MKIKSSFLKLVFSIALLLVAKIGLSANAAAVAAGVSDNAMFWILVSFGVLMLSVVFVLAKIIKGLTANTEIWKIVKTRKNISSVLLIFMIGLPSISMAQEATSGTSSFVLSDALFYALLMLDLIIFTVVLYLFSVLKNLVNVLKAATTTQPIEETSWTAALTDSVPIEREHEILTDHEYDGIRELDNNLPPWWVWGFYATIVFSILYLFYFEYLGGPSSKQEYLADMEEAKIKKEKYMALMANAVDENNVILLTDTEKLANGKEIYLANCAACHGQNGEGGVGPNFADQYWIHGGSISNIFSVIKYGVPTKGMISWESQLSPSKMQEVASYLLTFQGTNPQGAKEPQGELYVPETIEKADDENEESSNETSASTDSSKV